MKKYFQLQIRMLQRHFKDFGIEPALAYPILIVFFIAISSFLYFKLQQYASLIFCFTAVSILLKLAEKKRNDFLKSCFTKRNYFKVRLAENTILVLPFILYLCYKGEFFYAVILYTVSLVLSLLIFNSNTNFTIPTPFSKKPFEFSVGFRNTFYIYPIIYWLNYKAIEVNNFNLGIFSLILLFLILMSYYLKIEKDYVVWIHSKTAKQFIDEKMKIAFKYALVLSLPISITLSMFFKNHIPIIIIFQLLCFIYLMQIIVVKYAMYPAQINLPVLVLFVISMSFPPFIFFTFPYFYSQSIKKLNNVLND